MLQCCASVGNNDAWQLIDATKDGKMREVKRQTKFIKAAGIILALCCLFLMFSPVPGIRAEGELRLSASQESVLLEPGAAATLNVNYSSDVSVKIVNVTLNNQEAQSFTVQNVLSPSINANTGGLLGSINITAPSVYSTGNLVVTATAENADSPGPVFSAQLLIPVSVNLPPPAETDPNSTAEGATLPAETIPSVAEESSVPLEVGSGLTLSLKLNGIGDPVTVNVSENRPETIPDGYSEVVAEIQAQNVLTYKKAGRLPLVYVSLVADGPESLYAVDAQGGNAYRFYPDIYTTIGGQSAIVTSLTETAPTPDLVSQSLDINGLTTSSWVGEIKGEEYTVIRAEVEGKTSDLYRYEIAADGAVTLSLFNYANIINPPSPTPVPTTAPTQSGEGTTTAAKGESGGAAVDWVFWGLLLLFLALLGGLVLLFLHNRRKRQPMDYRLNAKHYDLPSEAQRSRNSRAGYPAAGNPQARKKGIQLRELRPNDFDDVDRYFSERREVPQRRNIDPAARSGVRKPRIEEFKPQQSSTERYAGSGSTGGRRNSVQSRGQEGRARDRNARERNPYRSYYKPQSDLDNYYGTSGGGRSSSGSNHLQNPPHIKRVTHDEVYFDSGRESGKPPYGKN